MSDADVADVPTGPGCVSRLHHRLLRADCFDHRVRAQPAGEVLDRRDAGLAALGDDVGGAELEREFLPWLVSAHRDDPFGAEMLGAGVVRGEARADHELAGRTVVTADRTSSTMPAYS